MSRFDRLRLVGGGAAPEPLAESGGEARSLLIHAARTGDVRAFATLVDMYYARCLRFALHMLSDRDDAEEAVQDTFIRVHRALPKYEEREAFEPWLFRILANRCRTAGGRARRHADVVEYGEVPERPADHAEDDAFAWREAIRAALVSLPRDQREAFLMRHVEDLTYEDMSVATGARVSALKMRVKRACDALRALLSEEKHDG